MRSFLFILLTLPLFGLSQCMQLKQKDKLSSSNNKKEGYSTKYNIAAQLARFTNDVLTNTSIHK